ncbi:hypothetical protein RI844_12405 [Thalassotalea fonticola]|uniref:Membrane protein YkvI n=1 Tax=Thalassotalea fonticola TaxID=3065649 RepID=A0ABZ0GL97_9GAMM|nr:hypothetical protein RI844_12405 [Colwelliaceae bacterium S1-1]
MVVTNIFKTYFLPGFVIQSVLMAGGFGTGREIVEFFTNFGSVGGLLGLLTAFILFSLVISLSFKFSLKFAAFDYQNFFSNLIGKFAISYEITYLLSLVLVLSIISAAAGKLIADYLLLPKIAGIILLLVLILSLLTFGRKHVANFLVLSTSCVYLVLSVVVTFVFIEGWEQIVSNLQQAEIKAGWFLSGSKFTLYNIAVIPGLLFACKGIKTSKQATISGVLAAAILIIPGIMIHFILLSDYPSVTEQSLPIFSVIAEMGLSTIMPFYILMLFLTFTATALGLIEGFLERVNKFVINKQNKPLSIKSSLVIGTSLMGISFVLSKVGMIALIANGYSLLAYCMLVIYVVPLFLFFLNKKFKSKPAPTSS